VTDCITFPHVTAAATRTDRIAMTGFYLIMFALPAAIILTAIVLAHLTREREE
jgi:hypothetical protein